MGNVPSKSKRAYKGKSKRKYGGTRRYRPRVAGRNHMIKRLGQPIYIQNSGVGGIPTLTADGAASATQGPVASGLLPNTYETGVSFRFMLQSVIDYADLQQLFDRYKVTGVKLKFHYLHNSSFIPGYANLPTMYYAFDADDNAVPTNSLSVVAKGYCKSRILNANRPTNMFIRPRVTKVVHDTTISDARTTEKACWLDIADIDVPHYGLKVWLSDWVGGTDNNNALRIQPTYYLALKDTQ